MGQEKTQRENGREQRNEQQGRFAGRVGLRDLLWSPASMESGRGVGATGNR